MEVLEQHLDLEQVRAARASADRHAASIRAAQLKRVVGFYEEKASRMLGG
jgi:hypothetical protein